MPKKTKEIIVYDKEQTKALEGLHKCMGGFVTSILECDKAGLTMSESFEAIGIQIPVFLTPMLNQLSKKLPSATGTEETEGKDIVKVEVSV
jgi:hypothetical protein